MLYRPPFDLIYDVVGVAPLLDPSAPPGLMTVTLSVTVPITVKANELWIPAIVVAQAESKAEPESMDAYRKRRQMEDMRAQEKDPIPQGAEPVAVQGQGEGGDRSNAGELPTEG